jgi:hypothetical protein
MASSRESAIHFRMIETREALERGICEALESRTCEAPESGIGEIRESTEVQISEVMMYEIFTYERFGNQQEAKSKTLP